MLLHLNKERYFEDYASKKIIPSVKMSNKIVIRTFYKIFLSLTRTSTYQNLSQVPKEEQYTYKCIHKYHTCVCVCLCVCVILVKDLGKGSK